MSSCERVVVVGVDFTEMGDDAILEALTQVVGGAARVARFVYVHDPRSVEEASDPCDAGESFDRMRTLSAMWQRVRDVAALARLKVEPAQVRVHARVGHTVASLIEACIEHDADLLIVGTHARLALDRRILGPVADTLVRTAPCPVLVARPKNPRNLRRLPGTSSIEDRRIARRIGLARELTREAS